LHEDHVAKIKDAPIPNTKKEVRSFIGLTGFYRDLIPNYAVKAVPLTDLTKKGHPNKVVWGAAQKNAYVTLKQQLISKPDIKKQFVLRTDASDMGIGVMMVNYFQ